MSTSPVQGAEVTNVKYLIYSFPNQGVNKTATFSLPSFNKIFVDGKLIENQQIKLTERLEEFLNE